MQIKVLVLKQFCRCTGPTTLAVYRLHPSFFVGILQKTASSPTKERVLMTLLIAGKSW